MVEGYKINVVRFKKKMEKENKSMSCERCSGEFQAMVIKKKKNCSEIWWNFRVEYPKQHTKSPRRWEVSGGLEGGAFLPVLPKYFKNYANWRKKFNY